MCRSAALPHQIDRPACGRDYPTLWLDGGHQPPGPGRQQPSANQNHSWICLTQSESFLNLAHPIRIILEFGSPNHATGKFVPAIRATTTNRDKVGLLFNCLELYGCNPHVHTLLRSRENIGACFTCKNFTMGLTVGWLLSPSSLCFPQYLAG